MSGFGNFLAGAVGGGGQAVANIAGKYIDDEIARNRAQALADIQHQTMVRGEEYMQSAPVQERRLGNERAGLQMRNTEALSAEVAKASNKDLRQAKIDERVGYLQGTTPAEVEAQNAITEGTAGTKLEAERIRAKVMTPLEIERAAGISDAQWAARERYDQRLDGKTVKSAFEKLPEAKKLEVQQIVGELKEINKAVVEAQAGGGWDASKNPGQKQLAATKAGLEQRLRGILVGDEGGDPFGILNKPQGAQPPAGNVAPSPAQAPAAAAPSANVMEQRRVERAPAPAGSPQAKWEARQQEARAQVEARRAAKQADVERARSTFDEDAQTLDPLALVQKYGDMSSRSALDTPRLARLKQIERTIR